jgi:hypothetical protein
MLSFTNVYFFESGLFNGLRPIQIKKIFLNFSLRKNLRLSSLISAPDWLPLRFRRSPSIVVISDFCNHFLGIRLSRPRRALLSLHGLDRDCKASRPHSGQCSGAPQILTSFSVILPFATSKMARLCRNSRQFSRIYPRLGACFGFRRVARRVAISPPRPRSRRTG